MISSLAGPHCACISALQGSWPLMQPLAASTGFAAAGGLAERMGVFVGIQQMEYGALAAAHLGSTGAFTATGTPFSVAAGRLSFHYGLKGPLKTASGHHLVNLSCTSKESKGVLNNRITMSPAAFVLLNGWHKHCGDSLRLSYQSDAAQLGRLQGREEHGAQGRR